MDSAVRRDGRTLVRSEAAQGSLARELACMLLGAAACEVTYLSSAAIGLWLRGLPLDYERWGGYIILSIIVIPQAFAMGYLVWVVARSRLVRRQLHRDLRVALGLGGGLGLIYYLLAGNVKWVVPWMLLVTRRG